LPEPVTREQEEAAAALFDLSSFDGMVDVDAPPPPPRAPVILEAEEEPIVAAGAFPPSLPPTNLPPSDAVPEGFELGSGVGAMDEVPLPPPPTQSPRRPPQRGVEASARSVPKFTPTPPPAGAGAISSLIGLVVTLAVAGAMTLAWFGIVEIPWLIDFLAARRAPPAESSAPAVPSARDARGPRVDVLDASPTLGAFTYAPVALLQAESLAEQRPDLLFVVAPLEVDGVVYHRLLAGPARDSAEAVALRARLATVLTREDPASWRLQRTPLAFDLGEADGLAKARSRVAALSRVDIPAYVLELPAPIPPSSGFVQVSSRAGAARYRVYAGAYADAHEAAYLAAVLARLGETQARLIERTGRHIE
jgi:hypothetical protein